MDGSIFPSYAGNTAGFAIGALVAFLAMRRRAPVRARVSALDSLLTTLLLVVASHWCAVMTLLGLDWGDLALARTQYSLAVVTCFGALGAAATTTVRKRMPFLGPVWCVVGMTAMVTFRILAF